MAELNQKSVVKALVIAASVIGLTPFLAGALSGVASGLPFLTAKLLGDVSLLGVGAGGVVAFVADLAVEKWM